MSTKTTRGIANRNPGNIRKGEPWQGLAPEQPDVSFCTFLTPVWGLRAIAILLINYQDLYNLRTIRGLIGRWAPQQENNTSAYVYSVAHRTGLNPDAPLNMHSYEHLRPIVEAIVFHENGMQPYSPAQYDKALEMAGVLPPKKTVTPAATATIVAASTATAAPLLGQITTVVQNAAPLAWILPDLMAAGPWILGAIAVATIGYLIYKHYDDKKKGL